MKDFISDYWDYIEKRDTKKAERIYNFLNRDKLYSIITDGDVYWLETTNSNTTIPNYVYDDIETFMKGKGFSYLYSKY